MERNSPRTVTFLSNSYVGLEKLGKGTYGSVYKAQKKNTNEIIAIKKIKLDVDSEGIPSTALREISILKKMVHPNIVSLKEICLGEKKIELYLEYFPYDLKKFLDEYKENPKVYTNRNIKYIMLQIVRAIDFLHSRKILHRDLKPQNILICNQTLTTKIADFGLSRVYSFPIRPYTKEVLTLWYRAPELMLGLNYYSTDLDMWSIGCILAELYLKRPLFIGDSEIDQLYKIFRVYGTPNEETLPGYKSFPDYNVNFPRWKGEGLRSYIGENKMDSLALDLLEKIMTLDPCKRLTAREALNHPYFYELINNEMD